MTGKSFWIAVGLNTAAVIVNILSAFFFHAFFNIAVALLSFGVIVFLFLSRDRKEKRDSAPTDMRDLNGRF